MDKDKQNVLSFSVEYAKVVESDDTFTICELDLLHLGKNRNNSVFTKDGVENSQDTIFNKPVMCIFNCEEKSVATDYKSHAKCDRDINNRVCIGTIPMAEYSKPRWVITEDGYERLRVNALLWSFYNEPAIKILEKQDDTAKLSIEVEPIETHKDINGNLVIDKFNFLGGMLLSNSVMEGMKGSNLKVLKYSVDEMLEKTSEYLSKFSKENNDSENIFDKIKNKKGGDKVKLGHRELESKIWELLSEQKFVIGKEPHCKYYVEDIYDGHIVAMDNETGEEVKFKYSIDNDGIVQLDFGSRKIIDAKKPYRTFAKEDIGTEEALKVDKDKISDDAWGSVDKTTLRENVVKAKNFKTIAKDVFLDLREGWEDGEVSKLKYPVMQLDGDTLIYNRGALSSAKGYAEKNNETDVLEKLRKIYKRLKLDFEVIDNACLYECGKSDYEEDDCECKDEFAKDDDNANSEESKKDEAVENAEFNANESNEENANVDNTNAETENFENKPTDNIEMSANDAVDASAQAEMLNKEAETNKDLANEQNDSIEELKKKDLVIAELTKIRDDYEKELGELRKFKADTEERQKLFKVEQVLSEVEGDISKERKFEFKKEACNYSLETIDTWANAVKAEAFKSAKNKSTTKSFARMDLWGAHNEQDSSDSLWKCSKK